MDNSYRYKQGAFIVRKFAKNFKEAMKKTCKIQNCVFDDYMAIFSPIVKKLEFSNNYIMYVMYIKKNQKNGSFIQIKHYMYFIDLK